MFKITGNNIYLTRGDSADLHIDIVTQEGDPYEMKEDDRIVFRMKKAVLDSAEMILTKEIGLEANGIFHFEESDTKSLEFDKYRYEIELVTGAGDHYTIISDSSFEIGKELESHG